jgi:hypothetical protein
MKIKVNRKIKLLPLPEGVEVGKLIKYYSNGWRVGRLRSVKGNAGSVVQQGFGEDMKRHAKLIPIEDMAKLD